MQEALSIEQSDSGTVLALQGALDIEACPLLWDRVVAAAQAAKGTLRFDLSKLDSYDGVGIGLLTEAGRLAREAGVEPEYSGATEDLEELLRMAHLDTGTGDTSRKDAGFFIQIGNATAQLLRTTRLLVEFTGAVTSALARALLTLNATRIRDVIRNCVRVGADAVPVVSLLGALIGFILAVQSVKALENVGAVSMVPMVVGFATLREFAPLIVGIILAGRSGSAFAAELGTMKVTEELDAYATMSLDPMVVLVAPRIVAATLVAPLLCMYSIVLGVIGGSAPMLAKEYTFWNYAEGVIESVAVGDVVQAAVKATIFGFLISAIGCFHGLQTGRGADAVGASATRAVVAGIVSVLVADSIVSTIFYNLGI